MRLLVIAWTLALAGCFSPGYHSGNLRCGSASPSCPDGFHCATDNTCWANGQDPVLTTGSDVNGTSCSVGSTCLSGFCADGVCCDRACNGQCEACDTTASPGSCQAVSGMPHGSRGACAGSGTCGGTCDGTQSGCAYPPSSTICGAACDGHCDGTGSCSSTTSGTCPDGFACGVGACKTSCSVPGDCQTNFQCMNNACVRVAESDCLDGLDNNGDGLVDCADPTCNAQVTCVPAVATPVGLVAASCAGGVTGTHINQGFMQPSTCHACGCSVAGSCTYSMIGDNTGTGCFNANQPIGTFTTTTTCLNITPSPGKIYYSIQAKPNPSATCAAAQTGVPDTVSYSTSSNFCPSAKSPNAAACAANQVCVAKPASGPVCTLVTGTSCPSGYPTSTSNWFADGTSSDTRSCTCTGCNVTGNGTCDTTQLNWVVHTAFNVANACVDDPTPYLYCAGPCCSWTTQSGGGAMDMYWAHSDAIDSITRHNFPANTGATCNGGTGTVSGGSATPGATLTVCCH